MLPDNRNAMLPEDGISEDQVDPLMIAAGSNTSVYITTLLVCGIVRRVIIEVLTLPAAVAVVAVLVPVDVVVAVAESTKDSSLVVRVYM